MEESKGRKALLADGCIVVARLAKVFLTLWRCQKRECWKGENSLGIKHGKHNTKRLTFTLGLEQLNFIAYGLVAVQRLHRRRRAVGNARRERYSLAIWAAVVSTHTVGAQRDVEEIEARWRWARREQLALATADA